MKFLKDNNECDAAKYFSILNPRLGFPDQLSILLLKAFHGSGVPPENELGYLISQVAEVAQTKLMGKSASQLVFLCFVMALKCSLNVPRIYDRLGSGGGLR